MKTAWRCPDEVKAIYPEIESRVMPMIQRKARRVARRNGGIAYDDAVQEGRMALMRALARYDYNRAKGEIERYANTVLDNTYNAMIYKELMKARMPRAVYLDEGQWKSAPRAPISIDGLEHMIPAPEGAETGEEQAEVDRRVTLLKMKMLFRLKSPLDREVFKCKTNPPAELVIMLQNEGRDPTLPDSSDIAKFLGFTKNVVDWSLFKIRQEFTYLSRKKFSDLFDGLIEDEERPMIHMSQETSRQDDDYVRETIAARGLDPRPLVDATQARDYAEKRGVFKRKVERYSWGVVLVVANGHECRTLVIEGKLNVLSGEVFGPTGLHEPIPVPWYGQLSKKLNTKEAS